jgi:hypothetical protein
MGKIYKRKRRSCAMCKPHKMGGAPADTDKQRAEVKFSEREREEIAQAFNEAHNARGRQR